tara:strand:- start:941 stop:1357 length:417 start_codon:yes stop_codon:yes gene_type:complete
MIAKFRWTIRVPEDKRLLAVKGGLEDRRLLAVKVVLAARQARVVKAAVAGKQGQPARAVQAVMLMQACRRVAWRSATAWIMIVMGLLMRAYSMRVANVALRQSMIVMAWTMIVMGRPMKAISHHPQPAVRGFAELMVN